MSRNSQPFYIDFTQIGVSLKLAISLLILDKTKKDRISSFYNRLILKHAICYLRNNIKRIIIHEKEFTCRQLALCFGRGECAESSTLNKKYFVACFRDQRFSWLKSVPNTIQSVCLLFSWFHILVVNQKAKGSRHDFIIPKGDYGMFR